MPPVKFTLSQDDFMAYARWHFKHSADAQASFKRMMFFGGAAFLIFAYNAANDPATGLSNPTMFATRIITSALVFGVFFVAYLRIIRPLLVQGMMRGGIYRDILGDNTIEFDHAEVSVTNSKGRGRIAWPDIKDVVEDTAHIYFVLGPLRAFIVPRSALANPAEFFQTARAHFDARPAQ